MNLLLKAQKVHPAWYITIAVGWRIILVFLFSLQITTLLPDQAVAPGFGFIANDYHYFINPAEHFYQTGEYALEEGVPFAGRMPGYGIFYLLFRFFLSVDGANFMIILTQAILGGIGAYALARVAEMYFKRFSAFVIVFAIGLMYPVTAFFDYQTLAEGFAINLVCIAFYFILLGQQKSSRRIWFLIAGVLLTWSVFSRPYLGILLPLFGLFILWKGNRGFGRRVLHAFLLGLPFMLAILAWNVRNYQQLGRVVLMETSTYESYGKTYSMAWLQIRNLIYTWGGEPAYFEPGSAAEWFRKDQTDQPLKLPEKAYAAGCFTAADLKELKQDFQTFHYSAGFDSTLQKQVAQTALKYRKCYEEQQTLFDRWLLTANVVKKATIRSGSSYMPPITPQWLDRVFRILYLGTYYLLIAGWLFAAVFIHRGWIWLLPAVVLLVGIFKVSSVIEHRYFLTIFPFVILGFVQCLLYFGQYLESDKKAV